MSAPNKSFDPVEVAVLRPEAVEAAVADALAAVAAAADLDALKAARLAHAGDRSPLALANREIGALPPQAKAEGRPRCRRPNVVQIRLQDEAKARSHFSRHESTAGRTRSPSVLQSVRHRVIHFNQPEVLNECSPFTGDA